MNTPHCQGLSRQVRFEFELGTVSDMTKVLWLSRGYGCGLGTGLPVSIAGKE